MISIKLNTFYTFFDVIKSTADYVSLDMKVLSKTKERTSKGKVRLKIWRGRAYRTEDSFIKMRNVNLPPVEVSLFLLF